MQNKKYYIAALAIVLIALFLTIFSSSLPDGLESVAIKLNFSSLEQELFKMALLKDYTFPVVNSEYISTAMAGLAGVIVSFTVPYILFSKVITKKEA